MSTALRRPDNVSPYDFEFLQNTTNNDLLDIRREHCSSVESASSRAEKTSRPNYAREAVRQVLSAATAISAADTGHRDYNLDVLGVTIPVVVTEAPMFAVMGLTDGSFKFARTHRELVVSKFELQGSNSPVWVVDEEGLEQLADEFLQLQAQVSYDAS